MPREFVLQVDGEVGGKGRPRTRIGYAAGKPIAFIYPDPDSAKTERLIKGLAFAAFHAQFGSGKFEGPVELTIEFWLRRPVSWSRKQCESAAGFYSTAKPDLDNRAKLVMDAFNDVVWIDDSQVSDLIVRKRYSHEGRAFVLVRVRERVVDSENDLLGRAKAT